MAGYLSHALMVFQDACRSFEEADSAKRPDAERHRIIMFGVAAITLDAARVDRGSDLPDPIISEEEQFIALAFMLRCAPAHDIAEPRWQIRRAKYERSFSVGPVTIDLTGLNGKPFDFSHIGHPEALVMLGQYAQQQGWA